jgi:hypothetical protein
MLVTSQPSRSPDLARYTSMVRSGADSVSAWREVFGNLDAVGEIKGHVRRRILSSIGVQFSTELPAVRGLVASATSSEVHTVLGAFQSWMESDSYGSPFLPVNEEGATSLALAVRGLVEVANDLRPEGESRLLSIDSGSEDWLAQYFVACGLTRLMSLVVSDEPSALAQPALSAIKTVLEARPALPHALAMKARALLASPEGREAAAEAIREAQALAPHRPDYAFLAADVHVRRRDYPAARAALGPFLSSIAAPEVRESARRLMTYVLDAEQRENAWKAAGAEQHQRVHGLDEPPPRSIPVYRELRNGEQRVAGELHRIECTPKVTTLHVTVDGRPLRFIGGRMDTIEFVTYRNDQTGEVACARRVPPDSVLVTFATTQVKGSSGFPIAVEFLPTSR